MINVAKLSYGNRFLLGRSSNSPIVLEKLLGYLSRKCGRTSMNKAY
jgi:hypothetical protein